MIKTTYHRNLPHFQPIGEKFFITFRLYDAFFDKMIKEIIEKKNAKIQTLIKLKPQGYSNEIKFLRKQTLILIDKLLDNSRDCICHLSNDEIATVVEKKLHQYNNHLYRLIAYTIMPNHVHLVIDTSIQIENIDEEMFETNYIQLYDILQYIKGGSAFEANKILMRKGQFWQRESVDHIVKDDVELNNIIHYILQNPVKANLIEDWKLWKHSYVDETYL